LQPLKIKKNFQFKNLKKYIPRPINELEASFTTIVFVEIASLRKERVGSQPAAVEEVISVS